MSSSSPRRWTPPEGLTPRARALLLLALVIGAGACRASAPAGGVRETFELLADPRQVTRVVLIGDLPGAPRRLRPVGGGRWRVTIDGLRRGRRYSYRFRVFRRDLRRWIEVTDPVAWQLDASRHRNAVLVAGAARPPRPRPHRRPRLHDLVIYELCPREFVPRSTPFADPRQRASAGNLGRVFRLISARIRSGYFGRLGVNALELMPVVAQGWVGASGRPRRTPWGYQALSWYAINGDYGSARDFAELIDVAHQHGLAVLVDYSLDHGYNGRHNPSITALQPSWRKRRPTNPWNLLELDLAAPGCLEFVRGALRRLVVDFGVDGFRFDWTEKVSPAVWTEVARELRRLKRDVLLISENPVRALVTRAGFDGVWDFFFQWEAPLLLRRRHRNWDGYARKLVVTQDKLVQNLEARAFPPDGSVTLAAIAAHRAPPVVRYLESHDLPRIARRRVRWQHGGDHLLDVDGDGVKPDWLGHGSRAASRQGALLLATVPGAIMLFQGQEFGARDRLRWRFDPLAWDDFDRRTFDRYARLLRLRRKHRELRSNDLRVLVNHSAPQRMVLAYSRGLDPHVRTDDSFVAVFNFSARAQRVALPLPARGRWRDVVGTITVDASAGAPVELVLPPRAALLLRRDHSATARPVSSSR